VLWGIVAFLLVFHIGGGWYFSNVIHDRALSGEERRASLAFDPNLTVQAVDADTVTLRPDATAPVALDTPGLFGLAWEGGRGTVGEVVVTEGDDVTRRVEVLSGDPPEQGDAAQLDPRVFASPAEAGVDAEDVTVEGDLGAFPAWYVPADGPTWAILLHGNSMSRLDVVRWLPAFETAGIPTLTITYRNDAGAPEDPSGLLRYGRTEWEDLEAAVRYALDEGSDGVTLFGTSMGGGIVEAFFDRSDLAEQVRAVALDAPMLNFSQTVDDNAAREPLIGPIDVPPTLTWTAKWIADLRFDVGWSELDYLDGRGLGAVPTLILHGDEDLTVPIGTSRQAAEAFPDTVTLVECPGADHIECWNLDPPGYEARVTAFLTD
jgi:pimeloyl-ACP methyl ester carboxylesterase